MGVVNRHRGNFDLAIECYTKALNIDEATLPVGHENRIKTRENLEIALALKLSLQVAIDYYVFSFN